MFRHTVHDDFDHTVLAKWYLLAFLAGNVNAGGFLATGRMVTHVTGFATHAGVGLAQSQWAVALSMAAVPICFLSGAILAGYLVDHRRERHARPRFDIVMGIECACLVLAALGGRIELFGNFTQTFLARGDTVLLALLCLASGLQNAAVTSASGGSVRTSHLTGVTTDLGLGIIRMAGARRDGERWRRELRLNWLRVGTITGFLLGSAVGALLFVRVQYLGFLLPAGIAAYAVREARRDKLGPAGVQRAA